MILAYDNVMDENKKGLLFISGTILSWGVLAILLKLANNYIDSVSIVWIRFSVAFSLLLAYLSFKDRKLLKIITSPPKLSLLAAILLAVNYLGFMKGVELTTPSNAQILIQIGPITLALYGVFFLKEKLRPIQILGFSIAIIGFIIFYQDQLTKLIFAPSYNLGVLWVVLGALTWSVYAMIQKKLVQIHDSRSLNLIIYGLPALLYFPFVDFNALFNLSLTRLLFLSFLGLNTLIAYGCLSEAFKYLPANKVSILITTNPLITILLSLIFAWMGYSWAPKEALNPISVIGALFVITGAALVVKKPTKQHK